MYRCPKCGIDMDNAYHAIEGTGCLRRQLAAANERAERAEGLLRECVEDRYVRAEMSTSLLARIDAALAKWENDGKD